MGKRAERAERTQAKNAATPAQRPAWLEETIVLAYPVGALPAKCMISLPREDPVTTPAKKLEKPAGPRAHSKIIAEAWEGRVTGTWARVWCLWLGGVLALLSAATAAPEPATARPETPSTIAVHVRGARSSRGELVVVLYGANPDDFLKKGRRLARERVPARTEAVTVRLAAPGPGLYAVAVYHDENGNRKFDRRWFGLPVEGFGVSNNPKVTLRAPSHAEAAFPVGRGLAVVEISLRY